MQEVASYWPSKTKVLSLVPQLLSSLSGYSDDGSGHLQDRNGFLFPLVGRLIDQMDLKRDGAANRLVSMVVTRVEREKDDGAKIQAEAPPTEQG